MLPSKIGTLPPGPDATHFVGFDPAECGTCDPYEMNCDDDVSTFDIQPVLECLFPQRGSTATE